MVERLLGLVEVVVGGTGILYADGDGVSNSRRS